MDEKARNRIIMAKAAQVEREKLEKLRSRLTSPSAPEVSEDKKIVWAGNRWITNPDCPCPTCADEGPPPYGPDSCPDSAHDRSADNAQSGNERLYERVSEKGYRALQTHDEPKRWTMESDGHGFIKVKPPLFDWKGKIELIPAADYDRVVEERDYQTDRLHEALEARNQAINREGEYQLRAEAAEREAERLRMELAATRTLAEEWQSHGRRLREALGEGVERLSRADTEAAWGDDFEAEIAEVRRQLNAALAEPEEGE